MVNGFEFVDENWGRMFYPYDETISVPEDVLQEIIGNLEASFNPNEYHRKNSSTFKMDNS